ncbi:MAG TPA: hypothetical protein VH500_19055 [Nitrososphaeraceae archaeon]
MENRDSIIPQHIPRPRRKRNSESSVMYNRIFGFTRERKLWKWRKMVALDV